MYTFVIYKININFMIFNSRVHQPYPKVGKLAMMVDEYDIVNHVGQRFAENNTTHYQNNREQAIHQNSSRTKNSNIKINTQIKRKQPSSNVILKQNRFITPDINRITEDDQQWIRQFSLEISQIKQIPSNFKNQNIPTIKRTQNKQPDQISRFSDYFSKAQCSKNTNHIQNISQDLQPFKENQEIGNHSNSKIDLLKKQLLNAIVHKINEGVTIQENQTIRIRRNIEIQMNKFVDQMLHQKRSNNKQKPKQLNGNIQIKIQKPLKKAISLDQTIKKCQQVLEISKRRSDKSKPFIMNNLYQQVENVKNKEKDTFFDISLDQYQNPTKYDRREINTNRLLFPQSQQEQTLQIHKFYNKNPNDLFRFQV